jgi:hypothetical protein
MEKNVALAVFSVLFTLLLLEVAIRATGWVHLPYLATHEKYGVWFKPGAFYEQNVEGYSKGNINKQGLRDYEHPYQKAKNVYRILVIGDSFIEAFQVDLNKSFCKLLERNLNLCSSRHYEVINAGRSGMGTAEEFLWYLDEGVKYKADQVILSFYTGNDFRDNSPLLSSQFNSKMLKPFFIFQNDSAFTIDFSFRKSTEYRLRRFVSPVSDNSILFSELFRLLLKIRKRGPSHVNQYISSDLDVFLKTPDSTWRNTFQTTANLIRMFKKEAEKNGSILTLMLIPDSYQVQQNSQRKFCGDCNDYDFNSTSEYFKSLSTKTGLHTVDLKNKFTEEYNRRGDCLYGFGKTACTGHWNEKGHQLAADIMSEEIILQPNFRSWGGCSRVTY